MKKQLLTILSIAIINCFGQSYVVSTVAGTGIAGLVDGPATTVAQLDYPYGLAYDGDSIIYFSDGQNHAIRKLNTNNHVVTTIAGGSGVGLQDGIGAAAKFDFPDDVFYKGGFLYVGDNLNNCIRKINLTTYSVTTIAGTGVAGYANGPANTAQFQGGNGIALAVANNGDIYVADGSNAVVRLISNGQVTTVAGTPGVYGYVDGPAATAKFHRPRYLALDTASGDLYITDINNNVIRKLSNGVVSTFSGTGVAGGNDGVATAATFSAPVGIAMTYNGFFYVVDGGGNKLRKINPLGTVTTIAGNGVFGFQDGPAANAEFYYPQDVCYDKHCYIYMADRDNNRIRRVSVPEGPAGCITGINEIEEFDLSPYPNPNKGIMTISEKNDKLSFKVLSSLGEVVYSGLTFDGKIDMSGIPNGIYFLSILKDGQLINKKIIIQQ